MPLSMSSPSISTQPIGRRPRPDNERTTRQSTFPVEWDPPMSTRAPIARSRPARGVHHLIAQSTPMLAPRLPSADPLPLSAATDDPRLDQADADDAADAPKPRESRVPGSLSLARAIHDPNASGALASSLGSPPPSCHPLPGERASLRVNHQSNSPLAARPPRHADADTRSPPPPLPI